jgi:hypothetical protein
MITQDRHLNFRGTTNTTAALGGWEDTFSNLTSGLANLGNSVGNIISAVKGGSARVVSTPVNPYSTQYSPYYGTTPMVPAYNYPATTTTSAPKDNTLLYTGIGIAALAGFIFLKNR